MKCFTSCRIALFTTNNTHHSLVCILSLFILLVTSRPFAWEATKSILLKSKPTEYRIEALSQSRDSSFIHTMEAHSNRCTIGGYGGSIFKDPILGEYFRLRYIKKYIAWECADAGQFIYLKIRLRDNIELPAIALRLVDTTLFHLPTDSVCGRPIPPQHNKFAKKLRNNPQIGLDSVDCSQHGFVFTENGRPVFYPIQGRIIRLDTFLKEREYSLWSDSACSYVMEFRSRRTYSICGHKIRRNGKFMPQTHFGDSYYSWNSATYPLRNGQYRPYIKCLSAIIDTTSKQRKIDVSPCIERDCELEMFEKDSSPFRMYCPSPTGIDSFRIYRTRDPGNVSNQYLHLGAEPDSSPR